MKVTFNDFTSTTTNFVKCLAEMHHDGTESDINEEPTCVALKIENDNLKKLLSG